MPRLSRFLPVVLLTLWLDPAAGDPLSAPRRAAWDRFTAIAGAGASVRWSAVDDVPIAVRALGGTPLPGFRIDHAAAVQTLFRAHADLFRLRPGIDDFRSIGEREQGGVHHVRMSQTWRGIPVRGGQYMVSVGSDGALRMIGGRSVPDVDADTEPAFDAQRAIAAARASRSLGPDGEAPVATLAIEPADGERDRLVWQVEVGAPGRSGEWEVLVDARDGTIVGSRSRAFGASGCAAIYDPSPLAPAREDDFAIADPAAGAPARLEGANVRVLHETAPLAVADSLRASCWDFHFDPMTQPASFDQANVYRQVDHFIREFHGANGFPGFPQPMTVILKAFRCGDANTGETIGHTVWLTSEGCGYKSSTRDADIIDHETQHAMNNFFGLEGGLDLGREIYATALHESFANYFACAAQNDPVYAEYFFGPVGFANCNSDPAEYNYARRLELGVGILQNYLVGMIWSGALWDIRTAIGPIIDRIALESLDYLSSQPTMHEAVTAVLEADADHHGGAHQAALITAFTRRGLSPYVRVSGPNSRLAGQPGTWAAIVGSGTYSYKWTLIPDGNPAAVESLGTAPTVTVARGKGFTLHVQVTGPWGESANDLHVDVPTARLAIQGPRVIPSNVPGSWSSGLNGDASTGEFRWSVRCVDEGCSVVSIGNLETVEYALQRTSWLRVTWSLGGLVVADSIVVEVDVPPVASMFSAPDELAVGESVEVYAGAQGGIRPYTWRWTLGTPSGTVISTDPWARVTGTPEGLDLVLIVTATTGTASAPVVHTISPKGVPLVADIEGPASIRPGVISQWTVQYPSDPPTTTTSYEWTRTCLGPECVPERIGTEPLLSYAASRNFDLGLRVTTGIRTTSVTRRIRIDGMPVVAVTAPEWLAPGEPTTLRADVDGGRGPYTYRWTRDGVLGGSVLGTHATLSVRGDDRDLDISMVATSADGLSSDPAHVLIHSGLGPRPVPDHPAFRVDRSMSRDGSELTFTLEGRPGSPASLRLLDISGREAAPVFEGTLGQGFEFIAWHPGSLRSGVYLAVARIAGQRITRRVTVVR